jgi:hypothetical protein
MTTTPRRRSGGVDVWLQAFLISALGWDEWSASSPGCFALRVSPRYPLDRRLGGPQSRSERGGEEKNSQPRRESKPRTPIVQPVAQSYTDWAIMALVSY